ncbi:MAG TPA: CBASS oligonucleotide cyclase [Pyrinomonadaceae bacterium]|nr:CBASS oligonucleotide cyclase [Pyrinomonadaceae bacterium]
MMLNDSQIGVFVAKVLHLGPGKRKEFIDQVNNLIDGLTKKISGDSSFKVKGFKKTGSLIKGTVLKPKGDYGVDADVAVFLDLAEAEKDDIDELHNIILKLLRAVYPTKVSEDFKVQPRTLGIHFRVSGLDVDLVPVIPIPAEPSYGWQPSSQRGEQVKTSIQGQLDFIKNRKDADRRFRALIRLLKKWRNEHELDRFRSFTIELIAAHLYDRDGAMASLESGLQRFFMYVAQNELKTPISFPELGTVTSFPSDPVVILDPVNKDNNVAARLSDDERQEIVTAAKTAWENIETASWKDEKGATLDRWKEVMGRSFTIDAD